ncbi:MAG: hypothetical protein M3Y86_00310, partial [Verrucomicrobiota bacterium]|nr:hypothetical protein [Verrucomicrobiota bacterium]
YQLTDKPARAESFTPPYERRSFWLAQLLPLLALVGLVGWNWQRSRSGNREAQRIARLQHEATELQRKLRHHGSNGREYVANASRAVQLKTALAARSGAIDPDAVDAEAAAATFRLDDEKRARLQRLFQESDELRYSGGRNGDDALTPEKQREILELVENLHS